MTPKATPTTSKATSDAPSDEDDPIRWWEWFLGAATLIGAAVGVVMVVKGLLYIFALLHG